MVLSPSAKAPSLGLTCNVEMVTAFIPAKSVTSLSIKAPAAVTLAVSVTSALASIPSNLVLSPSAKAPSLGLTCNVEMVTAFIPAKSVTSLSIKAPAAVTLSVSVTSAPASMPSNFPFRASVKLFFVKPLSPTVY